jgi:Holliday junction resolvase
MSNKTVLKTVSKTGYNSNYNTGIRAENKIKNEYKEAGYFVKQSAGSRGPYDLKCTKNNITHYVQVKSSTVLNNPYISNSEIDRLKSTATKNNAISVIAKVYQKGDTTIKYAKNNKNINFKK